MDQNLLKLHTFGELKSAGYKIKPVRIEMRDNLLIRLRAKERIMPGIIGYEETVLPEIENGVLAGHHMVFLGERGQAKSRIIRSLALLLDEFVPAIKGCEINDDPSAPDLPALPPPEGGAGRFAGDYLDRPRPSLRRKARYAGCFGCRSHR